DAATQRQLNRGSRLVEILKQDQFVPLAVEKQVAIVYAAINGHVDDLEVSLLKRFEQELYRFLETRKPEVLALIRDKKQLSDDVNPALDAARKEFKGESAPYRALAPPDQHPLMASLKTIRKRIGSVKSTQQITKAMKMVAAAKLRRAQEAAHAARPYAEKLAEMLRTVAARAGDVNHPLLATRESERTIDLIVITSDRGLCGGF